MPSRGAEGWSGEDRARVRHREGPLSASLAAAGRSLESESGRWFLWREGATAALRSEGGNLVFPPATAASYSVDNWLLADGDKREAAAATDQGAFRCDSLGCIDAVKGQEGGAYPPSGRRRLKAEGAHALYIEGLSIRTETVAAARGRRPWVPDRAIVITGASVPCGTGLYPWQ